MQRNLDMGLKRGKARRAAFLDSPEESVHRSVQTPEDPSAKVDVQSGPFSGILPDAGEFDHLLVEADADPRHPVGVAALLQGSVVEAVKHPANLGHAPVAALAYVASQLVSCVNSGHISIIPQLR